MMMGSNILLEIPACTFILACMFILFEKNSHLYVYSHLYYYSALQSTSKSDVIPHFFSIFLLIFLECNCTLKEFLTFSVEFCFDHQFFLLGIDRNHI